MLSRGTCPAPLGRLAKDAAMAGLAMLCRLSLTGQGTTEGNGGVQRVWATKQTFQNIMVGCFILNTFLNLLL